jgi:hypothetical protein
MGGYRFQYQVPPMSPALSITRMASTPACRSHARTTVTASPGLVAVGRDNATAAAHDLESHFPTDAVVGAGDNNLVFRCAWQSADVWRRTS